MKKSKLNEQLIDAIFRVGRILRQEMSRCPKVANLSMLQLEILLHLKHAKKTTLQEIAKHFSINKSTTSIHIDNLKKMSLINRQINKKDRRIIYLFLSKKGLTFLNEGLKYKNHRINRLLTYVSKNNKETMLAIIIDLTNQIEKSYEK